MSESREGRLKRIHSLLAAKDFRRRAWRWLRPAPKIYSSVRVFVNGVQLEEVTCAEVTDVHFINWRWR